MELTFKNQEKLPPEFVKMLESCFRQKRKLVLSNLKNDGYLLRKELKEKYSGKRAEQLTVEDFLEIYEGLL